MSDRKEKPASLWRPLIGIYLGWCIGSAIKSHYTRVEFEAAKEAILAEDIPPVEKCLKLLRLMEPK